MKPQIPFGSTCIRKRHNFPGLPLVLAAVSIFLAPIGHAETVEVDPGEACNSSSGFDFGLESNAYLLDVFFSENKTLEYGEGTHVIALSPGGLPGGNYGGFLLDAAGEVITERRRD